MYHAESRHRFIELRVQGWSLARIAAELHVARRTLVDWNRQAQREVADLQAVEREALHERILVSHEEELSRLTAHLNRIEAVLAKRNLDCLSTESLFVLAATVRAQLRRLTAATAMVRDGERPGEILAVSTTSTQFAEPEATPSVPDGGAA